MSSEVTIRQARHNPPRTWAQVVKEEIPFYKESARIGNNHRNKLLWQLISKKLVKRYNSVQERLKRTCHILGNRIEGENRWLPIFKSIKIENINVQKILNRYFGGENFSENPTSFGLKPAHVYRLEGNRIKPGSKRLDLKARQCLKRTVRTTDENFSKVCKIVYYAINITDGSIRFADHFDFLFYRGGINPDHHKPHRDDVSIIEKHKNGYKYKMFTVIICLANNKVEFGSSFGTTVWLGLENKYLIRNSISTGSNPGKGIIFPSNSIHQGNPGSNDKDAWVLKLKIDIFINKSKLDFYSVIHNWPIERSLEFTPNTKPNKELILQKMFYAKKLPISSLSNSSLQIGDLPEDVLLDISTFLGKVVRCCCPFKQEHLLNLEEKRFRKECPTSYIPSCSLCKCSCTDCINHCGYNCECSDCEEERERDRYEDYYDCNGNDY